MSNSIDWSTLAVGALVGMGCRTQLKTAGRVAATTAANLAGVAATAAAQIAEETKSPESTAAQQWLQGIDQQLSQNGQTGNSQNGQ